MTFVVEILLALSMVDGALTLALNETSWSARSGAADGGCRRGVTGAERWTFWGTTLSLSLSRLFDEMEEVRDCQCVLDLS